MKRGFKIVQMITICLGIASFSACSNGYSIADFETKGGYLIDIRAAYSWEISQSIYCRVTKDGKTIVPLQRIGGTTEKTDDLQFQIVEDDKSGLVVLIEASNPHVSLALFDFTKKKYWPFRTYTDGWEVADNKGEEMIELLNRNQPLTHYALSSEVPGNVELKVSR